MAEQLKKEILELEQARKHLCTTLLCIDQLIQVRSLAVKTICPHPRVEHERHFDGHSTQHYYTCLECSADLSRSTLPVGAEVIHRNT